MDIAVAPCFRVACGKGFAVAFVDIDETVVVIVLVIQVGEIHNLAQDHGGVAGGLGGRAAAEDRFRLDRVVAGTGDGPSVGPGFDVAAGRGGRAIGGGDSGEGGCGVETGAGFHLHLVGGGIRSRAIGQDDLGGATIGTDHGGPGDADEGFAAGIDDDAADGRVRLGRVTRILVDDTEFLLIQRGVVKVGEGDGELMKRVAGSEIAVVDRPPGAVLDVPLGGKSEAGDHLGFAN